MTKRTQHPLPIVDATQFDTFTSPASVEGYSPEDELVCGNCGKLLFPDFTIENAQHVFVSKTGRTLCKCPACLKNNLVSTKTQKP